MHGAVSFSGMPGQTRRTRGSPEERAMPVPTAQWNKSRPKIGCHGTMQPMPCCCIATALYEMNFRADSSAVLVPSN